MYQGRPHRSEILPRLQQKCRQKVPIWIASAASGLVAQLLEQAGADCINTFHGARLRANGMGTMAMLWPIVNANEEVFRYTAQDILPAMQGSAFICICINANDPMRDMRQFLQQIKDLGIPAVSNIGPSVSYVDKDSQIYAVLRKSGVTFENEIAMLRLAKDEFGLLTIGVAFDEQDSLQLVAGARPDLFCFHAGTTKGGRRGFDSGETIADTARRSQAINEHIKNLASETICIAHGAAMEAPDDAQFMLDHAGCDGFWTGSSTERLPIEEAVLATGRRFAELRFKQP